MKINKNLIAEEISAMESKEKKIDIAQIKEVMRLYLLILKRHWNAGNEAEIIKMIKAAK